MLILIIIVSIYIFLRMFMYGIYEIKENQNKVAGISIIALSFVCLVFPSIILLFSTF